MRNLSIYLTAVATLAQAVLGLRHGSRQLRDQLAFPKYQIDFLNDLPLSHSDAERCRAVGVEAEDEFTQPRFEEQQQQRGGRRKRLPEGQGRGEGEGQGQGPESERLEIMPMNLPSLDGTHTHEYLCLMPSANSTASQMAQEEEYEEVDPAQGWAALSHLNGKCLYTKQGWFTYSYCHDSHIRQFRQAPHQHPHPPGGFTPEEDQRYEAYTLGQATGRVAQGQGQGQGSKKALPGGPGGSKGDAKNGGGTLGQGQGQGTTSIDRLNHDHAVSYGLQPSSRYLVQRWSDGTRCDKTLRPREIEVQVHCSMTTTDMIYLVKELSICNYVMIIHSPHLCSLPGFRADHSQVDSATVRCREVISDDDFERWETGEALDMPYLTIGKEEAGHKDQPSAEAGEGKLEDFILQEAGGRAEQQQQEVVLDDEDLRAALKLLSQHFKQAGGHGRTEGAGDGGEVDMEEEVLIFTIDEEGDEPIIIEGVGGGGDGGGGGGADRGMIKNLVKQYLAGKDKPKRDTGAGQAEREEEQEKKKDKKGHDEL